MFAKPDAPSPVRIFLQILGIVSIAELAVMLVYELFGVLESPGLSVLDAVIMATVSAPFLYFGVVRRVARRLLRQAELEKTVVEQELQIKALAAEEALRQSEANFALLFRNSSDLIFVMRAEADGRFRCLQVNDAYYRVTGVTPEQIIGKTVEEIPRPQEAAFVLGKYHEAIRAGGSIRYEEVAHMPAGTVMVETTISPVFDTEGRCTHILGIARDVTERKKAEEAQARLTAELRYLADHDTLTGLVNRRFFEEEVARQVASAHGGGAGGAVLFLDLDNFKFINDTLGHQAGDEILKNLAHRLASCLRGVDTLARLGGDEFAVLLAGADAMAAQAMAERILHHIRNDDMVVAGQIVDVTASIGIALFPDHGATPDEVLARADLAMYRAKEKGRNQICLHAPDDDRQARMQANLAWAKRIRSALHDGRFVLYLQPIWDLRWNRISQYEALLRMVGEDGGIVPPSDFLPVAEQFGLIRDIDRWVVRRAIHLAAERRRAGRDIALEVNLSGRAFSDQELLPMIREELAMAEVDPASFIFEITETAAVTNMEEARRFIEELKAMGCRFALDDFGVGFSSFNYLKHLPVDCLKIDGSFVRNLAESPVDQHLVKAMVEVARGLGKEILAEFVGDAKTLDLLREMGVDYAQGYYIGQPCPWEETAGVAGSPPALYLAGES